MCASGVERNSFDNFWFLPLRFSQRIIRSAKKKGFSHILKQGAKARF